MRWWLLFVCLSAQAHVMEIDVALESAGDWYIVGDSQSVITTPGGVDVFPWQTVLEDRGLLEPTTNAAGGRGYFRNGFSGAGGDAFGDTWDFSTLGTERFIVIHLGTNDGLHAGVSRFRENFNAVIDEAETLGYVRGFSLFIVAAAYPQLIEFGFPLDIWPVGQIQTWMREEWGGAPIWGNNLYETFDSVHRTQHGQNLHADDMYRLMVGAKRRFEKDGGVFMGDVQVPEDEEELVLELGQPINIYHPALRQPPKVLTRQQQVIDFMTSRR